FRCKQITTSSIGYSSGSKIINGACSQFSEGWVDTSHSYMIEITKRVLHKLCNQVSSIMIGTSTISTKVKYQRFCFIGMDLAKNAVDFIIKISTGKGPDPYRCYSFPHKTNGHIILWPLQSFDGFIYRTVHRVSKPVSVTVSH